MSIETQELPVRPRRRLITPLTLSLAGVLACALGFIGGVRVQKSAQDDGGGGAGGGLRAALAAAGAPGARGAPDRAGFGGGGRSGPGAPTVGEVANVKDGTIYVTDAQGTTVKVKTNDGSSVTRTAKSSVEKIRPGDRVIVQGSQNADGTVKAASIVATAPGARGAALFGGGSPPSGGSPRRGGDAIDLLFGGG